jgi:hypothetical protein
MTYIKVGMLQPHAPSMCPSRIASTAAAPKKHPASKKNSENTPNPIRWNEVNFSPFLSHATLNRSASCLLLVIGSWSELWDMSVMLSGHWLRCKRLSVGHGSISLNLPQSHVSGNLSPAKRRLQLEPSVDRWTRYPSRHADFRVVIRFFSRSN